MNPVLHDATFQQLRDLIYAKCGIYIPDTKKYLVEKKIAPRLQARNLGGYEDYLAYLKYRPDDGEQAKLFDAITTNETYFFREPQQFDVLLNTVVPEAVRGRPGKDIRIWSAASSTGEEPYTISMLLMEKCPAIKAEIHASDISGEVIAAAKKGVYGSYAVRNVPPAYLQKYFRNTGWSYELNAVVRNSVRFMTANLINEREMRALSNVDVIFCRNVLIYFDEKAKQKAVSLLYDSLRPGGKLIIGSSESLHNVTRAFRPVTYDKVVVYQKP